MTDPVLQKALQDADQGRLEAAIAAVRFLSSRAPKRTDALQVLGMLLIRAGRHQQALHHFTRTVELHPNQPVFRVNLGNALLECGKPTEAIVRFREALALDPDDQPGWHGLMLAQAAQGDQAGWLATAAAALARWPDWTNFAQLYVHGLQKANHIDEALEFMSGWLVRHPDDLVILSSQAHMLSYRMHPIPVILAAHQAYGAALRGRPRPPRPNPEPDRILRVGILSGDLRTHSVGFFADAFLSRCPPDVQPIVFSTLVAEAEDPMAERFRSFLPDWREVGHLEDDDAALDREIRKAEIDVLLELSGHTWHHRLGALKDKPAPVIIHALGNASTTGHPAIDWRLADSITDPPGSEGDSTEKLLRLNPCFLCFRPLPDAPAPEFPEESSPITFASFNNTAKISPETIGLWGQVLEAVPGSRLMLKSQALAESTFAARLADRFAAVGIAPERLELFGQAETIEEHLAQYRRVHVALDPIPYNGTTTTCEALWMGVPAVVLEGDRHASRVGASLLRAAGYPQFVAPDAAAYVRLASELAQNGSSLRALRQGLRTTLSRSTLLDADTYAQRFHEAIRHTWREWCGTHN